MRLSFLLLGPLLSAGPASAYDGRIGDSLMELRLSPSGQGLSFGQFLSSRVPVSLVAGFSMDGGRLGAPVGSLNMRAGYEHHDGGSAILPRASLDVGMGFDDAEGVGAVFGLRGGLAWYAIRSLGLGVDVGVHRRVGVLRMDAALSLISRF